MSINWYTKGGVIVWCWYAKGGVIPRFYTGVFVFLEGLHHFDAHFVSFVNLCTVKEGVIMVEQRWIFTYYIVAEVPIHHFLF